MRHLRRDRRGRSRSACALGFQVLERRGQEGGGITSFDDTEFFTRRGLGHVVDNFSRSEANVELMGGMQVGQVRFSTTEAPSSASSGRC
jgi:amidophosphoribosyltransferase